MKEGFRQSMAWLHTWTGLVVGWILFFVFLTGTLGYFDTEIDRWMQPERPLQAERMSLTESIDIGLARLQAQAPNAKLWIINPPSVHAEPDLKISWRDSILFDRAFPTTTETLDATGTPLATPRDTGGGQLLYQMHYRFHYLSTNTATWIVGICTMFMLVAIVSGVITHKRIFRDFFTFRPRKGLRSWLDAHNVLSVMALPFHLMITYSGLIFFMFTYMQPIMTAEYGTDRGEQQRFYIEAYPRLQQVEPAGIAAQLVSVRDLVEQVTQERSDRPIVSVSIAHPGDANARVLISRERSNPQTGADQLMFDGVTGARLLDAEPQRFGARKVNDALIGLHEGLFAGPLLRWLYFFSGLLGTVMIATGLVHWTVKRKANGEAGRPVPGLALVERLNVGTIVGLPIAIAGYFWANRLIPADAANRSEWEAHAMFILWALALLYPLLRPIRRAWIELMYAAAALYTLLPLVNAITTDRHLGVTLPLAGRGDWGLASVDLSMLAVGILFAAMAQRLRRSELQPRSVHAPLTDTSNLPVRG
jgi:uncharacterized iron-regulated membrane protein